jgi:hypothetical protein
VKPFSFGKELQNVQDAAKQSKLTAVITGFKGMELLFISFEGYAYVLSKIDKFYLLAAVNGIPIDCIFQENNYTFKVGWDGTWLVTGNSLLFVAGSGESHRYDFIWNKVPKDLKQFFGR